MGKKMLGSRVNLCARADTKTHPRAAARTLGRALPLAPPFLCRGSSPRERGGWGGRGSAFAQDLRRNLSQDKYQGVWGQSWTSRPKPAPPPNLIDLVGRVADDRMVEISPEFSRYCRSERWPGHHSL